MENLRNRLWSFCIPEPNSGCWLWLGALSEEDGYGTISIDGKGYKAHRKMFEVESGQLIPHGIEVCHRCDIPCCINPDHLFLGTHLDNMRDRDRKNRRKPPKGITNGFAKLNDDKVRSIRSDLASGILTQMQIADIYGCDQTTISLIKLGRRWAHVI